VRPHPAGLPAYLPAAAGRPVRRARVNANQAGTNMATPRVAAGVLLVLSALALAGAEDPYLFFEWKVTYGTKTLLGAPQKVILINGEFPGPRINCSSNNNIVVNVFNQLDQPLLFTWSVRVARIDRSKDSPAAR
jgi:hypothetical protein